MNFHIQEKLSYFSTLFNQLNLKVTIQSFIMGWLYLWKNQSLKILKLKKLMELIFLFLTRLLMKTWNLLLMILLFKES